MFSQPTVEIRPIWSPHNTTYKTRMLRIYVSDHLMTTADFSRRNVVNNFISLLQIKIMQVQQKLVSLQSESLYNKFKTQIQKFLEIKNKFIPYIENKDHETDDKTKDFKMNLLMHVYHTVTKFIIF